LVNPPWENLIWELLLRLFVALANHRFDRFDIVQVADSTSKGIFAANFSELNVFEGFTRSLW